MYVFLAVEIMQPICFSRCKSFNEIQKVASRLLFEITHITLRGMFENINFKYSILVNCLEYFKNNIITWKIFQVLLCIILYCDNEVIFYN